MAKKLFKLHMALHLWLVYGLQWRDQYMKFGPLRAWAMAETILEFREEQRRMAARCY